MKELKTEKIVGKRVGKKVSRTAPQISVVIPIYNAAEFIAATLDSVLSQTFTDYETILVNDGSPDTEKLEKTLAPYFENLVYIKQENGGTAAARNTAIRAARGEWLAFLDGDDIWLPEYLAAQVEALAAKKCDLIYADALFFGDLRDDYKTFMQKSPSAGIVTAESLISGSCNIITSGTIVRRNDVLKAGLFDENLPRIGMEDFDLWFRLAKSGLRLDYQRLVLLKYRVRPNSLSGSNIQRAEREIKALKIIGEKYSLTDSEKAALEKHLKTAVAELALEKGKFHLAQGNYKEARENFRQANRFYQKLKFRILLFLLAVNPKIVVRMFKKLRPGEFSFIAPKNHGN